MFGFPAIRPLLGVFLGLALTGLAFAQPQPPAGGMLTSDAVGDFIASFAAVKAKADELRSRYDVPEDGSATANWRAWAAVGGARSELDATVEAYGFSDFNSWIRTLSAVAQAYAFSREGADLGDRMTEALDRVRGDPDIPAAQKEMMILQLQHTADAIAAMQPPRGNIEAVAPHIDRLGEIFGDDG